MTESPRTNPWKIGFLILAIAVALWITYAVTVPRIAMKWSTAADFGNMFGAIGALFSGLALAGVVVAVLMQKEELELQREELVATREELKRSTEAQTASSAALSLQIDIMQRAARLEAYRTLADYYGTRVGSDATQLIQQQMFINQIERLLNELDAIADSRI